MTKKNNGMERSMNFLTVWLLTVIIEFIIIYLFIKNKPWTLLFYSVIINSLTLPIATYTYIYILNNFLLIEIFVMLAESILLKYLLDIKYSRSTLISVIANTVTALLGYILY